MSNENRAKALFASWAGECCLTMEPVSAHGSSRRYWRLAGESRSCIATYNEDVRENEAFFYYCKALLDRGVRVPQLYAASDDRRVYLQQDLGDTTLYDFLQTKRQKGMEQDEETEELLRQVLDDLAEMQVEGRSMDFSHAYPREQFDRQSMQWDLNYFKYYFLKLRGIAFDEELLEQDFQRFIDYLMEAECGFFLYRDFQSRNVMLHEGKPYYIDFQGGRRGAAQYDVAAFLYSSKSNFTEPQRRQLLHSYMDSLSRRCALDEPNFVTHFYAYTLIRIMQAMGAYGFRGYFERKSLFLSSIPVAIANLQQVVARWKAFDEGKFLDTIPHLRQVWQAIIDSNQPAEKQEGLTVTVGSFSYRKGLPEDPSGNGGGYVFDCRALPNPGRYPQYRDVTGRDKPVVDFLQGDEEVERFLASAEGLVGPSIQRYLSRQFNSLTVYFGCTGGQHRSVYCAERMAKWIVENFDCHIIVNHREQQ